MTPNEHPLSSNWIQGAVESALKLDPKKLNFKDPRAGGTLYGELTCFTPSDSFQDIASSSLPKLNKAVDENILKRFPASTHAQRRKELKGINFLEILIYIRDNPSKQVAVYLPLKPSSAQGTNLTYQPIVCQKEYGPDAVTRDLPFQCAFSLRVGPDAVLRVRTYQQMLPYLPEFRSLVKARLAKYVQA